MTDIVTGKQVKSPQLQFVDLLAALAILALLFLVEPAIRAVLRVGGAETVDHDAFQPLMNAASHLIPIAVAIWYLSKRGLGTGLNRLGKDAFHLLWEVPLVVLAAPLLTALVAPVLGLTPTANRGLGENPDVTTASVLGLMITGVLLTPFLEELIFRRMVMGYFDTVMPAVASIFLSSVLFAVAHIDGAQVFYTFIGGICFAVLARRHRSIWAGVIAHVCNNLSMTVLFLAGTMI